MTFEEAKDILGGAGFHHGQHFAHVPPARDEWPTDSDAAELEPREPTDLEVITAMMQYGGSFVRALGIAARLADRNNLKQIKAAFPEYWSAYTTRARADFLREQQSP